MTDTILAEDATPETPTTYARFIGWLGGRKFVFAAGVVGSAHYLVQNKHIADGVYSAIVIATIAAYLAANVTQRRGEAKATKDAK